jgi:hypothetical protein
MSRVPSSRAGNFGIERLIGVARIAVVSALLCLGAYAAFVAWERFGPGPAPAKLASAPAVALPAAPPTTDAQANSPATLDTRTAGADAEPAADSNDATPVASDEPPSNPPPPVDVGPTASPAVVVVEPAPSAGGPLVPILTVAISRLWARSGDSIEERIKRAAESVEKLATAAAKRQDVLDQPQQPLAPASPAADAPPEVKTARSTSVVLINPPDSGGVIHYLADGAGFSLYPSQMHQLDAEHKLRVEFHRGGTYGDAVHDLGPGTYAFQVTENGWDLVEQPAEQHAAP